MPYQVAELSDIVRGRRSEPNRRAAFAKRLSQVSEDEAGPTLHELTKGILSPALDHLLTEILLEPLQRNDRLFDALGAYLLRSGSDTDYSLALLRLLDDVSGRKSRRVEPFRATLGRLANADDRPVRLRASALRRLRLEPTDAPATTLRPFLASRNPWLVNAAARAIARWERDGNVPPGLDRSPLLEFAMTQPAAAGRLPSVILALASWDDARARSTVASLAQHARGDDRARPLHLTGPMLDSGVLSSLIRDVIARWDGRSELALATVFTDDQQRLDDLYDRGDHLEYLYVVSILPASIVDKEQPRIERLRESTDRPVARRAGRLLSLLSMKSPTLGRPSRRTRQTALARAVNESIGQLRALHAASTTKVADGFDTQLHKADALYRDLDGLWAIIGQHWHACVYLGFQTDGETGTLSFVQAGRPDPWDSIELPRFEFSVASPDTSVAETIEDNKKLLVKNFLNFDQAAVFQGPRRTAGLTADTAERIAATAFSFLDKEIDYTGPDMLVQEGSA